MPTCPFSSFPRVLHTHWSGGELGARTWISTHVAQSFLDALRVLSGSGMGGSIHGLPLQGEVHAQDRVVKGRSEREASE